MNELDRQWFYNINHGWTNGFFDWLMPLLSQANKSLFFWAPIAIIVAWLLWKGPSRNRWFVLIAIASIGLSNEACDILKKNFVYPRPCVDLPDVILRLKLLTSNGTASAHSANMAALAVSIILFYKRWSWFALLLPLGIGLSRIYCGVHYPFQVFFGWTAGASTALALYGVHLLIVKKIKSKSFAATKKIDVIAHRGASGCAPENTIAAFDKAVELGAEWMELDARLTADKQLAVIHDKSLERTTKLKGFVYEKRMDELSRTDAGSWFKPEFNNQTVSSLADILARYAEKIGIVIEIKDDDAEAINRVALLVSQYPKAKILIVTSHSRLLPHIHGEKKGWIVKDITTPDVVKQARDEWQISHLLLKHSVATKEIVSYSQSIGLTVWTWTVDEERLKSEMKAIGVDGIVTNYPSA